MYSIFRITENNRFYIGNSIWLKIMWDSMIIFLFTKSDVQNKNFIVMWVYSRCECFLKFLFNIRKYFFNRKYIQYHEFYYNREIFTQLINKNEKLKQKADILGEQYSQFTISYDWATCHWLHLLLHLIYKWLKTRNL